MRRATSLLLSIVIANTALGCAQDEGAEGLPASAGTGGSGGASAGIGGVGSIGGSGGMELPASGGSGGAGIGGMGSGGGQAGMAGIGGTSGVMAGTGGESSGGTGATGADSGVPDAGDDMDDPLAFAGALHELFVHDACTAPYPPQPDTCLHALQVQEIVTFGGEAGTVYDVTLRVRGLFEPTTINGGESPLQDHPYFKVGGTVAAVDYSHWHIEVSDPPATYWLNHYPSTSHTIYAEDFEAVIPIAAGAEVTVRVIDGNDRQIDNAEEGLADRRQRIEGVTPEVLDGQMLRLDVMDVVER